MAMVPMTVIPKSTALARYTLCLSLINDISFFMKLETRYPFFYIRERGRPARAPMLNYFGLIPKLDLPGAPQEKPGFGLANAFFLFVLAIPGIGQFFTD